MASGNGGIPPLEHFKLLYDYIKFHIGLYVATPPVFAVVATALGVNTNPRFLYGYGVMIIVCVISGVHGSWYMASRINRSWTPTLGFDPEKDAVNLPRRIIQHWLYWVGLAAGLLGLALAYKK